MTRVYHQTVKKVTEDYAGLRFNTAISQMMVYVNEAYKQEKLAKSQIDGLVKLLSPIVPHICEELWNRLGYDETLAYDAWPTYDESYLVENDVEIVVQVNGKVRAKLVLAKDASREEMEEQAMAIDKVAEEIAGKTVRKVITIPGRLVNIVAN